jgi:peptidoglycan/xylan/chitin deacetylase (PgdA/CDA1 family)
MAKAASVAVIWDFDSAIGQINATFPYNFNRRPLDEEVDCVGTLLALAQRLGTPMTFATVGAAAEDLPAPMGAADSIRSLWEQGHEIASHSWRHEWLPHLNRAQLRRSLLRSKAALEAIIGAAGTVTGFVPPFNRPMTWLRHGEVHPGDRWALPLGPASTFGGLLDEAAGAGYRWIRVGHNPRRRRGTWPEPIQQGTCVVIPHHHNGFDDEAIRVLDAGSRHDLVVISGHPGGLARGGNESLGNVTAFLEEVARRRDRAELEVSTVSQYLLRDRGGVPGVGGGNTATVTS